MTHIDLFPVKRHTAGDRDSLVMDSTLPDSFAFHLWISWDVEEAPEQSVPATPSCYEVPWTRELSE